MILLKRLGIKIRVIAFVVLSCLAWDSLARGPAQQPVKKIYLKKEKDLYFLCVDFDEKISFTPRIHILPNGIKILLSFSCEVMVPKTKRTQHSVIKGMFFERFSPTSLMMIVAIDKNVSFISKKYTANSIKICFQINRKRVVVIDAGHGGKDPGTKGVSGNFEKNITLVTAIELRNLLRKSNKYKVILTRDSDAFLSIDERKEKINSSNADFLISLHTDSNNDKNHRGMSVYTLPNSDPKSQEFTNILMRYVPNACQINNHPCRKSELKILKTGGPAVLVELGCISNKIDNELLHSQDFRRKTIRAIKYALDDFFEKEKR
jgi:N-acetylmuramoyl-L-alanine amidase